MRLLTQLKPIVNRVSEIKVPPKNVLLISTSEIGNDELIYIFDKLGIHGNLMYYIPPKLFKLNASRYISQIRKNKNLRKFTISPAFLKSKRSGVVDISYYLTMLYLRGYRVSTSNKVINMFKNLVESIINNGGENYSYKYFHIVIDIATLKYKNVSLSTLRKMRLGIIYKILSDPQLRAWFNEYIGKVLITIVPVNGNPLNLVLYDADKIKDDEKFEPTQYFTRVITLIKRFLNDKNVEEEVEKKIQKIKKVIEEDPTLSKHKDVVEKVLSDFSNKYPDEIENISIRKIESDRNVVRKIVAKAVKSYNDKSIEVENSEVHEIIKSLTNIKIKPIEIPEKMTPGDNLSEIKPIEPEVGNVTELKKISFEEKFEDYVKLFNYHLDRKGYEIVSVEKIETESDDIADTELDTYLMIVKDSKGKKFEIKFYLPKMIDGNFFIYKGVKRVFTFQLYPLPVSTFKPHETIIRTNFADITVTLETKFKRKTFFTKVLGKKIPAVYLFIAYYGNLKTFVDEFKIKYTVSEKPEKDAWISIKFGNKGYVNLYSNKPEIQLLLNGLKVYRYEIHDDTKEEWLKIIAHKTSAKFVNNLDNYFEQFIDPMTFYILKTENMPTEFDKLLWYACLEAFSGKTVRQTDLRYRRIRSAEILAVMLFKRLYYAIFEYEQSKTLSGGKTSKKLTIPIDALLNDLTMTDAQSQYQAVQVLNPLIESSYATRLSYSGYGGVKSDYVPMSLRNIDPTYFGQICPVDTPESQSAGAVQHFSTNAEVLNIAGKFKLKVEDENTNIFSIAVALNPFATANDPARNLMAASQQRHAIPLKNAEKPICMSGYENLPALLSSSDFAIRAKKKGKVVAIDDYYITVKYNDGTVENISLRPKGGAVNTALEYRVVVKEGDTVEPNQLLAENKYFFDSGYYKYGINLYTVIMPYEGWNFEDGIIMSETAAKKLMISEHIGEKVIRINPDYNIEYMTTELGAVPASTPIVKLTVKKPDLLDDIDDEESTDDLIVGSSLYFVLPYDIDILSIEVYASDKSILDNYPQVKQLIETQISYYKSLINKYKELGLDTTQIDRRIRLLANPFGKRYKGEKLKDEIIIIYKYRYDRPTYIGDKFANRHGNKGVVGRIIPDDLMPRDPSGKPFDIIMNPLGIVSRKNPGQLLELYFSRASKEAANKLKSIFESSGLNKAVDYIIKFYSAIYKKRFKNILDQIVNNLKNMSKSDLTDLITEYIKNGIYIFSPPTNGLSLSEVENLYKFMNLNMKDYVYLPEFNTKSKDKVAYGYIYWIKQEQLVDTKMAARSTGTYKSKVLQPTSGRKREGGQRLGELDVWSLASYDAKYTIKELMTIMSDEFEAKNRLISSIIKTGEASLEKVNPDIPESARILKVFLAGLMISEDLSFTITEEEEL